MEQAGYNGISSIRRQETFETDPKFAARSKSGSVRKGDLSLPVIGPRHLLKQRASDRTADKSDRRVLSPDFEFSSGLHSDKTYTKSLLGPLPTEDQINDKKAQNRLKLKKTPNSFDSDDSFKETAGQKKSKKVHSVKDTRKTDTQSVDSGDSLKENKQDFDSGAQSKPKNTKQSNNVVSIKEDFLIDNNSYKVVKEGKESRVTQTKASDASSLQKERKLNDKNKTKSSDETTLERKINDNKTSKTSDVSTLKKERKINDTKNAQLPGTTSLEKERKIDDKKRVISTNSTHNQKGIDTKKTKNKEVDTPQLKKVSKENIERITETDKSSEAKLKRESLRDKLTSTPVSNYDVDIAIKPREVNENHTQITKSKSEVTKQQGKQPLEKKHTKEKLTAVKVDSKTQKNSTKEQENSKAENKPLEVKTIKTDSKNGELKKNRLKHLNNSNSSLQENKKLTKDNSNSDSVPKKVKSNLTSFNERKRSSESLESGFASYRLNDNRNNGKDLDDITSLLSYTETEVGKPPENTVLDRPRSKNNKNSPVVDESRPISNISKHFLIQNDRASKNKDYREFEKTRPPSRNISNEDIVSFRHKHISRMEPVVQRKPGSERMTESYESIYEERRTLLEAEVSYRKRIKQLEDEINQFLKTIEDLRSENRALRNRIDSLENSESTGSDNEKDQLKISVQSLENQNKALESKYEKTEARLVKLENEREKLTSENNELTSKLTDLQVKYSKVDNELAKLKLEDLSSQSKADSDNSKYEKELIQLRKDLRTAHEESKNLTNENTILKTDKDVLKDEIAAFRSINKNLEALNEEMKNENMKSGELPSNEKMELKSQIIKLQTDNQTLNEENIKLKAENLKQVKSIHDLEKTAKSFESSVTAVESEKLTEIQDLKNENAKLKSEIKDLKETYANADGKIRSLESDNKTLEETLTQKKTELSELLVALKDDDKFDSEIKSLKADNSRLQNEIEEKNKVVSDSKKHVEEIKIEKDKFENEKNKLGNKIDEMLKINEDQKKQMAGLQEKLDLSRKDFEASQEKLKQIQKYENEISELKTKLESTENERDKILKDKKNEIEDLLLKMERNDVDHKEQMAGLKLEYEREIEELKKHVEFLQKEIDELKQLKVFESELLETKDELSQVKDKYSQMVVELESKSDLEQRNFQMNMKMTQMNNTIKQLEKDKREWLLQKQQFDDDVEAGHKRLHEENVKLKQRRGVSKVTKQIDKQIEVLERKQKDAETRVKQLEGWVGDLYDDDTNAATYVGSMHAKKAQKKKAFSKAPPPQTTVRIDHDRPRSLDDVVVKEKERSERSEKLSHSSTPSLPAIEQETRLTFGLGYTQLHRSRIKAAQKYRK